MTTSMGRLDWKNIASQLAAEGCAVLRGLIGRDLARTWTEQLIDTPLRSLSRENGWVDGEIRLLEDVDLPAPLDAWRRRLYERLVPIANSWNKTMGNSNCFPPKWAEFLADNHAAGQRRAQSFVHRLRDSEYQALHQCRDGEHIFPMQLVALLSEPGKDFVGGELVMTEQRPRIQSRPLVVPLGFGDAALIATARRPFKGRHGYYSVNTKHAVSRVRRGERVGLELSFHFAPAER